MELKFKRLEDNAILPIRGTKGAAGIDLTGTGAENECSAATGTQSQLKEQVESAPEPAAAQEGAEVSEGQA